MNQQLWVSPGKHPVGSLPGASSGLQPCPQEPLVTGTALPCCQESLEIGITCACPSHSSLQRGHQDWGAQETAFHSLQPLIPRGNGKGSWLLLGSTSDT